MLAGVELPAQRRLGGQRVFHLVGVGAAPVAAAGGDQNAPLGGQHGGAGELLGLVGAEHRRPVAAAQFGGFAQVGVAVAADRQAVWFGQRRVGDPLGDAGVAGVAGGPHQALRFGVDVGALPDGAGFGHGGDDTAGLPVDPVAGDGFRGVPPTGHHLAEQTRQRCLAAEQPDRLGAPHLALLGQRAGFVFGLPGFQGGLREFALADDEDRRRR